MNWALYFITQADALRNAAGTGALVCWILAVVALIAGSLAMSGEKLDAPSFIWGAQARHFAFRLVPLAIILTVVTVLTPTTEHACKAAVSYCVWK